MNQIEKNLFLLNSKINNACKLYNKDPKRVNIIAVSKKVSTEKIIQAIEAGVENFGENYLQEAQEKWPEIKKKYPQIKLHFIGNLQSNKATQIVDLFDCIHSLDSESAAKAFCKEIAKKPKNLDFFIQVNIGVEPQKSGVLIEKLANCIQFNKNICNLHIKGLMCIPPNNQAPAPYFALMNKLAQENFLQELSMGMSGDFEEAIALNSTYIRIGTAIFGQRQ